MSDFSKIRAALFAVLSEFHSVKLLNKLGLQQIHHIRQRTQSGIDLEGRPFKPYNEQYAERKFAETGIPTHTVNLTFNDVDGMLSPLKLNHAINADLTAVELLFTDPEKRKLASYHDQLGAGRSRVIRRFWGVNEGDEKVLGEIVEQDLNLVLQRLTE